MPNPGSYALVDGGSSINILYLDTLLKLRLKETNVLPTSTVFHGIAFGQSCRPLKSLECAQDRSRLADTLVIAEEKRQTDRLMAQAMQQSVIPSPPSHSVGEGSFKPAKETKQVPLDPANPKQVTIGLASNFK
ncbi:hypothetical protein ZWY2020_003005 [Hordeum vulgare]|nr:hypothetical protein ZWY2020_003005 [Hordeum vulgare]